MSYDWLLVGLGNPGNGYAMNRHNIGFMVIDALSGPAMFKSKYKSHFAEAQLGGQRTLLLKPQTYMNLSGEAVREVATFFKIDPERIAVFHDELDLLPGQLRIKKGGGHGGHNGLKSIDAHLGTKDYWRLRLGIGHPGHKDEVSPYVLSDFSKADQNGWLPDFIGSVSKELPSFLKGDDALMMTRVNEFMKPPKA